MFVLSLLVLAVFLPPQIDLKGLESSDSKVVQETVDKLMFAPQSTVMAIATSDWAVWMSWGAGQEGGLQIVDITDASKPILAWSLERETGTAAVATFDRFGYVA